MRRRPLVVEDCVGKRGGIRSSNSYSLSQIWMSLIGGR